MMRLLPWCLGAVAALAAACRPAPPPHAPAPECAAGHMAQMPPDSVPAWVYDPGNAVRGTWITGSYARDVLVIAFVPGTGERARAEAICAVQGEVIGGQPYGAEGFYYVRIPADSTQQGMRRAVAILDGLPQVSLVTPEFLDATGSAGAIPRKPGTAP